MIRRKAAAKVPAAKPSNDRGLTFENVAEKTAAIVLPRAEVMIKREPIPKHRRKPQEAERFTGRLTTVNIVLPPVDVMIRPEPIPKHRRAKKRKTR